MEAPRYNTWRHPFSTQRPLLMNSRPLIVAFSLAVLFSMGCRREYREDLDYSYRVEQTWPMDELMSEQEVVQFESVFWEPDDTVSLRERIVEDRIAAGRNVLEIGTGTGLLSILCLQNDAKSVVATDINPAAVACAKYNAAILAPEQKIDVRLVPKSDPGAYSVLGKNEKFDLILSNPPWEDGSIDKPADHAFYDPNFALMDSLLDGLPQRLTPGGRCLLAYGHRPAIERLKQEAERRGYEFKILDDRELSTLEKDFLPGMLLEIRPAANTSVVSNGGFTSPDGNETVPSDGPQDGVKGAETDNAQGGDDPADDQP